MKYPMTPRTQPDHFCRIDVTRMVCFQLTAFVTPFANNRFFHSSDLHKIFCPVTNNPFLVFRRNSHNFDSKTSIKSNITVTQQINIAKQDKRWYTKLMAMVKLSSMLTDINGKVGGTIFRGDQCKKHAQSWPRLINKEGSAKQRKRRKCFSRLIHRYLVNFTPYQAAVWQDYANLHTFTNKKGEYVSLTWWSMFVKVNINLCVEDKPIFLYPPGYPREP